MNKDMFKGIIGLLALGIYFAKFLVALVAYRNGNFELASEVLLIGMILEFFGFLYVMKK